MADEPKDQTVHHGTVENGGPQAPGNLIAIFAYLGILILIPFVTDSSKEPFVKYHIKQGFALISFYVIGWIVALLIGWIGLIGGLVTILWSVASIIFTIVGIINVLQGEQKPLPWIGGYAHYFNF